ncbi:MAG: hypothetical protein JWO87_792, partial [Phycisphaerales bacterium]|nr:hypothetical protein [Phycisphaerales bacterium]
MTLIPCPRTGGNDARPDEPYLDTIGVIFQAKPRNAEFKALRGSSGAITCRRVARGGYAWKLKSHVPTTAALELLEQMRRDGRCVLSEVHFAMDLMADTEREAEQVTAWMNERIVQPYRRGEPLGDCRSTAYWTQRRWRVKQFVSYVRPSKLTGLWCCHLEFRILSAEKVR